MAKTCNVAGCSNPQFGGFKCKYHQYMRHMRNGDLFKPKKQQKPPPKESKKRKKEHKQYRELSDDLWNELVEKKENRCFFCNEIMKYKEGFHHIKGRIEDNYLNREFLYPAHDDCHVPHYHHAKAENLIKEPWYAGFLNRLKSIDIQSYYKELRRIEKAELEFEE